MAIYSTYLGRMKVSGADAKAFSQRLSHARGTKAASASADSGKKLVAAFAKAGVVTVHVKPKAAAKKRVSAKKSAK